MKLNMNCWTGAHRRAAMQEKELIPALVNWYDKVLKNDVLSDIVKEVNEELTCEVGEV